MNNNDVLRRVRYIFDFDDSKMIALFALADYPVTRAQVSDWLKQEDDSAYVECEDNQLAIFLNGLINDMRGKREGAQPEIEQTITNNIVFRKLKIALNLKDDDILELLGFADFQLSKHELSAFFRKSTHKNHRNCNDQVLRYFLKGLQFKHRDNVYVKTQ